MVHRWQLSKTFVKHSTPSSHPDFTDIGAHYGVITRPDGTSFFTGKSGFWVAERVVNGKPTGEIIGTVGLGESTLMTVKV